MCPVAYRIEGDSGSDVHPTPLADNPVRTTARAASTVLIET